MNWDMHSRVAARVPITEPPESAIRQYRTNNLRDASGPPEIGGKAAALVLDTLSSRFGIPALVGDSREFVAFDREFVASEPTFVAFVREYGPSDRAFAPFDRALRASDREFKTSATTLKAHEFAWQAGSRDFLGRGTFHSIFTHHAAPHPNRA